MRLFHSDADLEGIGRLGLLVCDREGTDRTELEHAPSLLLP
jgi:hypothetical protein